MATKMTLESYTVEVKAENAREAEIAARFMLMQAGIVTEPFATMYQRAVTAPYEVTFAGVDLFDRVTVSVTGFEADREIDAENAAMETVGNASRWLRMHTRDLRPEIYGVRTEREVSPDGSVTRTYTVAFSEEAHEDLKAAIV